jgi:hypothetical protein
LAIALCVPNVAAGQDIAIERDRYWPDEAIEIHYEFSIAAGSRLIAARAWDGRYSSESFIAAGSRLIAARAWDGRYSSESFQERQPGAAGAPDPFRSGTLLVDPGDGGAYGLSTAQHDTLVGLSVQLFQAPPGRPFDLPAVSRSLAIFNPVEEAPGALSLAQGIVLPEQSITLKAAVPRLRLARFEPTSGSVVLYLPAAPLPNGTLLLPEVATVAHYDGAGEHHVTLAAPSGPGTYELQLRNADGFILDSTPLIVEPLIPLVALGSEIQEASVGERFELQLERPSFPSPWLQLALTDLVAGPGEGWRGSQSFPTPGGFSSSGKDKVTLRLVEPGSHRLVAHWQLYHQTHHPGDLLAGHLDYEVAGAVAPPGGPPRLSLPKGEGQRLGGTIEIGVLGDFAAHEVPLVLRLVAEPQSSAAAPPIAEWQIESLPALVALPPETPPGFYRVVLSGWPRGAVGTARELDRASLTLFPGSEAFALQVNGGKPVSGQLPFEVTLALPAPFRLDDPRFELNLVHLGGEIEGCRTLLEKSVAKLALAGESTVAFDGSPIAPTITVPGRYEARLQWHAQAAGGLALPPLPGPEWGGDLLLVAVPFEVTYETISDALASVQAAPDDTEDVALAVRLPAAYERLIRDDLIWLEVERQAERSHFGVERLSQPSVPRHKIRLPGAAEAGGSEILLSLRPGPYDVRLVQEGFCFLGSCRRVLLDRLLFEVVDEAYDGPLYTDLARDEFTRVGPVFPGIGLPGSCGDPDWLPPPEGIVDLRLVRQIDEAFVAVETPLHYGDGFHVEAELESPARHEIYGVTVDLGTAGGRKSVALTPDPENPRLLRSERLYLLWPDEER